MIIEHGFGEADYPDYTVLRKLSEHIEQAVELDIVEPKDSSRAWRILEGRLMGALEGRPEDLFLHAALTLTLWSLDRSEQEQRMQYETFLGYLERAYRQSSDRIRILRVLPIELLSILYEGHIPHLKRLISENELLLLGAEIYGILSLIESSKDDREKYRDLAHRALSYTLSFTLKQGAHK